jgi:hypothetical protein
MSNYCVRKKRKLVRRSKKAYFVRRNIRVYVFAAILSLSIMAMASLIKAVFN